MRNGVTVPTPGDNPDLASFLAAIEEAEALGLYAPAGEGPRRTWALLGAAARDPR
jgi:hypothetical protein